MKVWKEVFKLFREGVSKEKPFKRNEKRLMHVDIWKIHKSLRLEHD